MRVRSPECEGPRHAPGPFIPAGEAQGWMTRRSLNAALPAVMFTT